MCVHDFDIIQSYTGTLLYYVVITFYTDTRVRLPIENRYYVKL